MRSSISRVIVALWLALPLLGCRFPGREGPVPQSLATSRQLSQQGVTALEQGQRQKAEEMLAKAVKTCPVDPEARRHYAETLWQRGAGKEAIGQLEEAARLAPEDPTLQVRLAELHLALGEVETAARRAEQAIRLNPKLAAAWGVRGRIKRAAGEPQQALADCHRALGYAPDDRQILLEVAELHRQLNQPQRALQTLQTLADTYSPAEEPQHVLHLMGMAYMALGRYDDAVESLTAAVAREKPSPEILSRLGEAELLAGHAAEAAAAAQQALALEPAHQPSRLLLGRIELARQLQATPRRY